MVWSSLSVTPAHNGKCGIFFQIVTIRGRIYWTMTRICKPRPHDAVLIPNRPYAPPPSASRRRRRRSRSWRRPVLLRACRRPELGAPAIRSAWASPSGAPRADGFVLWTRLAPDPFRANPADAGRHAWRRRHHRLRDRHRSRFARYRAPRRSHRRAGFCLFGASRRRAVWSRAGPIGIASPAAMRQAASDARLRCRRPGAAPERLRFGFVSCANYEHGYFSAYRHLADENPDFVLFLGDYIYEYLEEKRPTVRRHSDGIEAATLPTYRNRYAQYRLDPDLQPLHARSAGLGHLGRSRGAERLCRQMVGALRRSGNMFLMRRAAAYQAFYEHMPVRPILSLPNGPVMRIYDRFAFGDLVEISMLDGRQYRSREACYAPPNKGGMHLETDASCPERHDAGRTMMGFAQEAWLYSRPRAHQGAVEFDRAGRADGAVPHQARRRFRRSRPTIGTAIRPTARGCSSAFTTDAGVQSGRVRRRHPFVFRQRPAARFRRSDVADRGDRIRRHLDLVLRAAVRARSRRRCPTIPMFISSRAAGAAMSASISSARTCRCGCGSSPTPPTPRRIFRRSKPLRSRAASPAWWRLRRTHCGGFGRPAVLHGTNAGLLHAVLRLPQRLAHGHGGGDRDIERAQALAHRNPQARIGRRRGPRSARRPIRGRTGGCRPAGSDSRDRTGVAAVVNKMRRLSLLGGARRQNRATTGAARS